MARYGDQFKATAVKLGSLPAIMIKDVAAALDIRAKLDVQTKAELKRLRELARRHKVLNEGHEFLKKAIRFASNRKRKSSSSSRPTEGSTESQ